MPLQQNISDALEKEKVRQRDTIELIASENFSSKEIQQLCGSIFTNKYAEGYPKNRYYNGCENVDTIEQLAIDNLKELFGCNYANVQPHSGANANTAVFQALLKPQDCFMGMDLAAGGHLSHGSTVNLSGKNYIAIHYGVTDDGFIDYDEAQRVALKYKPKLIVCGASAYPRKIDWERFREIADSIDALLMADIAHYAGLIATGEYPSPFEYADVVTSTTHKTLRGPRGGVIMWNDSKLTRKINSAVFPGTQGGPLMHIIAAKAQCFHEALQPSFTEYTQNVIKNSKAMAQVFSDNGFSVLSGGTDCHMFLLDFSKNNFTGEQISNALQENKITVNKNSVPNDPRNFKETSGIRIGTAAETTRGHGVEWFKETAQRMVAIIKEVEKNNG